MNNPYSTPQQPCPYCQAPMDADWVDIGVGMVQCGPYHCFSCNASEIGREAGEHDESGKWVQADLKLDADEERTGFYKGRISPYANQAHGVLIDHKTADALYRADYFARYGNPYNAPINRYA